VLAHGIRAETPISRDLQDANRNTASLVAGVHPNQTQPRAVSPGMNTRYTHLALLAVVLVAVVLLATGCGGGGGY
jgi:hypothetical protein